MKKMLCLLVVLLLTAVSSLTVFADDENAPVLSVELRVSSSSCYEQQPVSLVLTLVSSTPDIAFADVVRAPELKKGEFTSVRRVSPAGNAYEEEIGGRKFFCFPIEAYVVTLSDKGKYELAGGECSVGVSYPVVIDDPFWGRRRSSEMRRFSVPVKKTSIKVRELPSVPKDVDFSGSVGRFSIETVIPKGDIYINEEATAIVVLKGTGMIADSTLPEYRDAFKSGMKLKSVSESRNTAFDNGEMVSELYLECTFIPTVRDGAEIGVVTFDYFDPVSGEYRTTRSKPVRVEVKSTTSKRESLAI